MAYIPELEQIRKRQIIMAALRVVAREGYFHLSMEKVAREAGLSKGGVAHYFSSKKTLFMEVFVRFFENIFERAQRTLKEIDNPLEALTSFVWLYNWKDPLVNEGYGILFDFMSLAARDQDFQEIFVEWVERWCLLLREILIQGKEKGVFKEDMDEEILARCISAIYQGIGERWYLSSKRHSTRWAKEALERAIYSLIHPYLNK